YYLEMEYVEGPLLEEWLAGGPALAERLEIVAQAADALDTVHAAGIYHRDIKPSNILLTHREDGALLAKLSDFGLGAAEDQDLLRSISASRTEGVAGTWDYLAPELRGGGSASAQSDLYSLGVTLYQVAVGDLQRPLGDWEREVASEVLREDIRRCVATDPARRWGRAGDLARALRGHDQRARELRSRRRAARLRLVAGLTGTFALVVLLFGGYAWHQRGVALDAQRRERRARDAEAQARANADKNAARAKQEAETAVAVTVFLQNMLASASPVSAPAGARRPDVTVREVLDEAEKRVEKEELAAQPVVQAAIRRTIAVTYVHIGLPEKAKPHALKSVQVLAQLFGEEHDATLLSMETLGYVLDALGEYAEAEEIVRRAVAARERMHGKDDPLTLNALAMLGNAVHGAGKYKEAEAIRRRCFEGYRRAKGNNDIETLHALDSLAVTLFRLGKLTEAEQLHREALAGFQRGPGPDYPGALNAMNGLANVLMAQKKLAAAEQAYSDYLAASSRVYGKDHPHTATVMNYFGCTLFHLGRFAEAEGVQRDALAAMRRHWPEGHVEMFRCMCNLGAALAHQGKLVEARQHFEEALPGLVRFLGETHRDTVTARSNLESIRNALNKAPGREPPP
ncbi:MAG: serine/threonine protein kinase, partial [Planctomycetes bacterium]|nr:serine/threonine protein kinase [Planctomycetota bacterium]